jgi:succinate dehydrogenase/fumarate reductase flavoprotein subunit
MLVGAAGAERAIRARGGVIIACGGFEANPRLADTYLPLAPTYPVGHAANTGDGLRFAAEAGAALWHMYGYFGWFSFRTPEFPSPFPVDLASSSFVYVDADGRRFSDETGFELHEPLRALQTYLPRRPNRPRLPSYAIFDEAGRLSGPLVNALTSSPNDYVWSEDNSAEVERGWISRGEGAAELAAATGLDPAVLGETLNEYNAGAEAGRDDLFGRAAETLVPLSGTLYAIQTWPGVASTTGGPRYDRQARVLSIDGTPVGGLYAAGAVSMVWGHSIDIGGGLTNALVFGCIAGQEAAGARTAAGSASSA